MSELEAILPNVFFLREASEAVRQQLARIAICHEYPRGNILYYHGEPVESIYIVVAGQVKIELISGEGREVTLAVVRPAGVFGLVAALAQSPHIGTAVTVTECHLAKLSRGAFMPWLAGHHELHQPLAAELAHLLRDAYEKIGEQALLSVKRRLLATLLEIARAEGRREKEGEVVFVRPTHQELAERVGTTRVVVSRLLKELIQEEEDLKVQGRVFRVSLRTVTESPEEF